MHVEQLETPALLVDLDALERNQRRMMQLLAPLGIALRPHYKSHKCTAIAHMQIAAGAKGITCAKLSEAEDLILSGIEDVLIANQLTEPSILSRAAYLAGCCRLSVCVDRMENIEQLEKAAACAGSVIHCLVEYEVGMNRCGVSTPEAAVMLAKRILRSPHLEFMGIQAYAGQLSHEVNQEVRAAEAAQIEERLRVLLLALEKEGIRTPEVSGASTGTAELRKAGTVYTEVQAGSYLFMDEAYKKLKLGFENALFMLSTVVSSDEGKMICDAGLKSFGVDQGNPVFEDYPDVPAEMSEEHCAIYCANDAFPGQKRRLIPGHCCTTVNLHDMLYFVRGDKVVDRVPVTSRGKSR
ncbi:MAG: DSD1 family PLP-dependent enzyme [Clostridiaceae bacterium]|nr:DSD1 family PLP-dependent enzyme [Clostridiaceae bacterium]